MTQRPLTPAVAVVVLCLAVSEGASGQGAYSFHVGDAVAQKGSIYTQEVSFEIVNDTTVSAYSWGVCHDPAVADVCGIESTPFVFDLHPLGTPHFHRLVLDNAATSIPGSSDGASQALVVHHSHPPFVFPVNSTNMVAVVEYVALADSGASQATICSTIGAPHVEVVVVCCGGNTSFSMPDPSITTTPGTVTYAPGPDHWTFAGTALPVLYDSSTGATLANELQSVPLTIANTATNNSHTESAGFTMAVTYDPALVSVVAIDPGVGLSVLNGGAGPELFMTDDTGTGFSVQVVNTLAPAWSLPASFPDYNPEVTVWGGEVAVVVDIVVDTTSLAGNVTAGTTELSWAAVGGVENAVGVVCSYPAVALLEAVDVSANVEIALVPSVPGAFSRGDCNDDGAKNLADPIRLLNFLFPQPPPPQLACDSACDANDDGGLNLADAVSMLNVLFPAGPPIPWNPPESCGLDPTADTLTCATFNSCP